MGVQSHTLKPRRKESYARLDAKEVPALLSKIEAYQGSAYTRLGMTLMSYTFVRTGELIGARWEEFDPAAAECRIPASPMKMRKPQSCRWRHRQWRSCMLCKLCLPAGHCCFRASAITSDPCRTTPSWPRSSAWATPAG